jgi:hypothetical protein
VREGGGQGGRRTGEGIKEREWGRGGGKEVREESGGGGERKEVRRYLCQEMLGARRKGRGKVVRRNINRF